MSKVVFDISMSLDGFMTASDIRPDEPMGEGGQRLHEWAFGGDERSSELLTMGGAVSGANSSTRPRRRDLDSSRPVLFGGGTRMFEQLSRDHIQLEPADVIDTPAATHLRYRVLDRPDVGFRPVA